MQGDAGSLKNRVLVHPFPDPTPVLFLLAAASAILYWIAGVGWEAILLPCIFLLPIAVYLLSTNVFLAMGTLIVSAAMPHYFVEISGTKARPEHIATGLLCLAALFIYKREGRRPVWMFLDLFVVAIIFMNIFSSIFMSIAPSQTFKWSMQQMLVILPYFLMRVLANDRTRFRQAIRLMLLAGTIAAAYGILCFYSYRLFGTQFGVDVGQYGDIPGIYGSQFEANLLGSYCGASLIIMLFTYFREKDRKLLWGSAITFAGMVVSLSRAALGATMLAMAVLILYSVRRRLVTKQVLRHAFLVLTGVSLVLAASIAPLYAERFSTLDLSNPTADDTTKIRVLSVGVALERTLEHPLLGVGTNSFQLDFDYGEIGYTGVDVGGWIGNTELRIWHDTGLVGLLFFLVFLGLLLRRALRAPPAFSPPELMGLLLAGLVYCVSFQATDATILSFPWIHLGMIATGTSLAAPPSQTDLQTLVAGTAGVE